MSFDDALKLLESILVSFLGCVFLDDSELLYDWFYCDLFVMLLLISCRLVLKEMPLFLLGRFLWLSVRSSFFLLLLILIKLLLISSFIQCSVRFGFILGFENFRLFLSMQIWLWLPLNLCILIMNFFCNLTVILFVVKLWLDILFIVLFFLGLPFLFGRWDLFNIASIDIVVLDNT